MKNKGRSRSLTQTFIAIDRLEWYNSSGLENTEREEGEDMSMPKGKEEYLIENEKVVAFGISHSEKEMVDALNNEVFDKIFDIREHLEIVKSLSDTGFDEAVIMERLFPSGDKEDWEIGEAYAQVYAETNLNSNIPWGISRDIKNRSLVCQGRIL